MSFANDEPKNCPECDYFLDRVTFHCPKCECPLGPAKKVDRVDVLERERDELKAENEKLKADLSLLQTQFEHAHSTSFYQKNEIGTLEAENEKLRKRVDGYMTEGSARMWYSLGVKCKTQEPE